MLTWIKTLAITAAIKVISNASEINNAARLLRDEPTTFLIPISLTRVAETRSR
jgi:hypothetical protein